MDKIQTQSASVNKAGHMTPGPKEKNSGQAMFQPSDPQHPVGICQYRVYNQREYLSPLLTDIKNAQTVILLQSPYIRTQALTNLMDALTSAASRGVLVCAFVQKPRHWDRRDDPALPPAVKAEMDATVSAIKLLESIGAHVNMREKIHEKVIVIDEKLLWDGSLNYASHYDTSERVTRWLSIQQVERAIIIHKLDSCDRCAEHRLRSAPSIIPAACLGHAILNRRRAMSLSQMQLGAATNCSQGTISRIEKGTLDPSYSKVAAICRILDFELLLVPRAIAPAIEQSISYLYPQPIDRKSNS